MNKNKVTKIIKLSATWCQPCKNYKITFDKVKEMEEFKNIEFQEIDIENDETSDEIVEKFQIKSVPTTLLLDKNDEIIYKIMGNVPQIDLINTINRALNNEE